MNMIWPIAGRDFWKINDPQNIVEIEWTHNYYLDYKKLAENYIKCSYEVFSNVVESGHDNIKSDQWFIVGVFLARQAIELGLKSLICKVETQARKIENIFEDACHDLLKLFNYYWEYENTYLNNDEKKWLEDYLRDVELVDSKSDVFRFPFEDDFLRKYRNKFLDCVDVANNIIQAYRLIEKCTGDADYINEIDLELQPSFFIFATHGIGNCGIWDSLSDRGFHEKVNGYYAVIDYIMSCKKLTEDEKVYPVLFMLRNTLELCLKRVFYCRVENGVPRKVFLSKRRSHLLKKDLWKNVKPVIEDYTRETNNDLSVLSIVEKQIVELNRIDKNGDMFRYPTSYSLEYRFDHIRLDLNNVYEYISSVINYLDACDTMLENIAEIEAEMRAEYQAEMRAEYGWY